MRCNDVYFTLSSVLLHVLDRRVGSARASAHAAMLLASRLTIRSELVVNMTVKTEGDDVRVQKISLADVRSFASVTNTVFARDPGTAFGMHMSRPDIHTMSP